MTGGEIGLEKFERLGFLGRFDILSVKRLGGVAGLMCRMLCGESQSGNIEGYYGKTTISKDVCRRGFFGRDERCCRVQRGKGSW